MIDTNSSECNFEAVEQFGSSDLRTRPRVAIQEINIFCYATHIKQNRKKRISTVNSLTVSLSRPRQPVLEALIVSAVGLG